MDEYFNFKCNDHYSTFLSNFNKFFEEKSLVDVTLCVDNQIIYAHRIILSACSSYFKTLFSKCYLTVHPVVVLTNINFEILQFLLNYMYKGETKIPSHMLQSFFQAAEFFQIKSISDYVNEEKNLFKLPRLLSPIDTPSLVGQSRRSQKFKPYKKRFFPTFQENFVLPLMNQKQTELNDDNYQTLLKVNEPLSVELKTELSQQNEPCSSNTSNYCKSNIYLTQNEERQHICKQCGRKYLNINTLLRHKRYECGVAAIHVCLFCDSKFKRKDVLKGHLLRCKRLKALLSNQRKINTLMLTYSPNIHSGKNDLVDTEKPVN